MIPAELQNKFHGAEIGRFTGGAIRRSAANPKLFFGLRCAQHPFFVMFGNRAEKVRDQSLVQMAHGVGLVALAWASEIIFAFSSA
jgi:hypothetical protein